VSVSFDRYAGKGERKLIVGHPPSLILSFDSVMTTAGGNADVVVVVVELVEVDVVVVELEPGAAVVVVVVLVVVVLVVVVLVVVVVVVFGSGQDKVNCQPVPGNGAYTLTSASV